MTDMPMGEHTRENMELHIGAAFAGGAKLEEIVKAIRAALVRIFGEASDQFKALNDAMNAAARGEEPKPQEQAKGQRPHPCPDAGQLRPQKSTRTAYTARVQRIRPQARSAIKQRRNRRRE